MEKKYTSVLERLKKVFDEGSVPAILDYAGEDTLPVDVLSTLHTDFGIEEHEVDGSFFFSNADAANEDSDDGNYRIFSCVMNVIDDIDPKNISAVYEMAAKANFYVSYGGFGVDKDGGSLIYKMDQLVAGDLSEDDLFDKVDSCAGIAMDIVDTWIDAFTDVAAGGKKAGEAILDVMEDIL